LKKEGDKEVNRDALHSALWDGAAAGKSECKEGEKAEERSGYRESTCGIESGIEVSSAIDTIAILNSVWAT
jgi:hypothetical protein